jgi:hypothetical protein
MPDPHRILHVISRLDGYGGARTLRLIAAKQAANGTKVAVAALVAEQAIVAELKGFGIDAFVTERRWRFDPLALGRLLHWRRQRPQALVHAWDTDALLHSWLTGRRGPIVAAWDASPPAPSWAVRLTGARAAPIRRPTASHTPRARRQD